MHNSARSVLTTLSHAAVAGAALLGGALSAHAATLTENFNAPFPAWESGWFGTESDATNVCAVTYCLVGGIPVPPDPAVRGNAGDGLWLSSEHGFSSSPLTITFDPMFGASLTSFKLDTVTYVESTLQAWDMSGRLIFSKDLRVHDYRDVPPTRYQSFTIASTDGISSFTFTGPADGNTIVDNLVAVTAAVPEPASAALLLGGLALVGTRLRHRRG
jgi:hypothetical protein